MKFGSSEEITNLRRERFSGSNLHGKLA